MPVFTRLGVALVPLILCLHLIVVSGQSHQWKNRYSSCSVQCGSGVQFLQKFCYTNETIPKPALNSYCSSITITEKDVISCNTFPCNACERSFTGQSGTITSPYFPDKYTVPRYCRLTITVPVGNRALLGFSSFTLEGLTLDAFSHLKESNVCLCGTLIEVTDEVAAGRSDAFCGTKQPFSWVADSNSVLLEFVTESSQLFNRFKAHYSTIVGKPPCYEFIDISAKDSGNVVSPGFPNRYSNNLHCEYVLHADPVHSIVLTILEFELEPTPECDLDFLSIEDLYSRRRHVYCGTLPSASWSSDANEVLLTFHSNANHVYKGFAIRYETADRAPKGSQLFIEPEGTITSPGYPLAYPPNTKAHYRILADPAKIVVIKFTEFQTERDDTETQPILLRRVRRTTLDILQYDKGKTCDEADYVEVEDFLEGTKISYCGKLPPFTWFSKTNEVVIRFVSDADESYKGFRATYRTNYKRPVPKWELVFRAASMKETAVTSKWLDTSRGYQEHNPAAKSLKKDSPLTFKSSKVNDWANYGIRKVKIELYKAGLVVAAFHFKNRPGLAGSIANWFQCANLIYSTYDDLQDIECKLLRFNLGFGNFEITDVAGSSGLTCKSPTARLWMDVQDKVPSPSSPSVCHYEKSASKVAKFYYSTAAVAGLTAAGSNIATADVVTIWIQRECDQTFTNIRPGTTETFSSEGFNTGYSNNQQCDFYFLNGPFDRILLQFKEFSLEHDENCSKDYVEIEDLTTGRTDRFCGNQKEPLFTTDGNAAIVRFRTDSHGNFPGWTAEATQDGRNTEDCSSILTSASGNLTNADHPSAVSQFRLQGCETLIHADVNDRVTASFNKVILDLEDCPELTILDHVSTTPVIEVSGTVLPFSWTSTSNELILWYCTSLPYRSYIFYEGNFRATLSPKPATCAQYLDAEFPGTFNWPSSSLATGIQNCYIVLRTHPVLNLRVLLTFNNLVLKDLDCLSYMKITDTTTQRSDTTCESTKQAFTWTSDANEVIVQFYSATFSHHAVDGHFSSQPRPKLGESRTLTGVDGAFSSPDYPEEYPPDVHMEYILHGKAHEVVFINFLELDLEFPSTTPVARPRGKRRAEHRHILYKRQAVSKTQTACEYDYVQIKDSLDPTRNVKYCGNQLPFSWVSSGNEVTVEFVTDSSVEKKGFIAEYIFKQRQNPTACGGIFETSTGGFVSPRYPRDYPPNSDCSYILLALAEKRIRITFTSFNTEQDLECQKDSVEVIDKLTQKVDRYCGNQATPFVWTSDSNLVFVVFRSNAQLQFGGFTASYDWENRPEKSVCQYNYDETNGEIRSPRSSGLYPNLKECNYVITVQSGFGIQLTFVEFVLEDPAPNNKCEYDFLQIFDSAAGTSDKLCGSQAPFERLIKTSQVKLVFKSDFIAFFKGFTVIYEQVDLSKKKPDCNVDFTNPSGVFTSPNYPANYPLSKACRYSITVASGLRIKITFTDFNLEGQKNCPFDYVEITDVGAGNNDKFCGRKTAAFTWLSETNEVTVLFSSDAVTSSTGFRAEYISEAIPTQPAIVTGCDSSFGINLKNPSGKLTSPNYPRDYPLSKDCKVRITLDAGKVCEITFTEFELENEPNCGYDYLQLTSIPDGDTISICGPQTTPFSWTSKSNICELFFRSDTLVPARGYRAVYDAVSAPTPLASDCVQSISGLMKGRFTSPNYPSDYDLQSDCTTTITVPAGYKVRIVFQTFEVEYKDDCSWDWMQITDLGSKVKTAKLCGTDTALTFDSQTERVEVRLFSDAYEARKGYSATFTAEL